MNANDKNGNVQDHPDSFYDADGHVFEVVVNLLDGKQMKLIGPPADVEEFVALMKAAGPGGISEMYRLNLDMEKANEQESD